MAAATTAAPVMSLFMSSIDAVGLRLRPPESNVTSLAHECQRGQFSASAIFENDKRRRVFRPRRDSEKPSEPFLADSGLIPDLDRDAGIGGGNLHLLGQTRRVFLGGRHVGEVPSHVDRFSHDLPTANLLLDAANQFIALAPTNKDVQRSERMAVGLGLAQARTARAGHDPLDKSRDPLARPRIDARRKSKRHALAAACSQVAWRGCNRP